MVEENIPEQLTIESQNRRRAVQKKWDSQFIAGPIPIPWITHAASLPGKSLSVALAVWFESRKRYWKPIRAGNALLSRFHVSRQQGYRALNMLESAGLISIERHRGRSPVVTIVCRHDRGK